jgi:hypothetical protein
MAAVYIDHNPPPPPPPPTCIGKACVARNTGEGMQALGNFVSRYVRVKVTAEIKASDGNSDAKLEGSAGVGNNATEPEGSATTQKQTSVTKVGGEGKVTTEVCILYGSTPGKKQFAHLGQDDTLTKNGAEACWTHTTETGPWDVGEEN